MTSPMKLPSFIRTPTHPTPLAVSCQPLFIFYLPFPSPQFFTPSIPHIPNFLSLPVFLGFPIFPFSFHTQKRNNQFLPYFTVVCFLSFSYILICLDFRSVLSFFCRFICIHTCERFLENSRTHTHTLFTL